MEQSTKRKIKNFSREIWRHTVEAVLGVLAFPLGFTIFAGTAYSLGWVYVFLGGEVIESSILITGALILTILMLTVIALIFVRSLFKFLSDTWKNS